MGLDENDEAAKSIKQLGLLSLMPGLDRDIIKMNAIFWNVRGLGDTAKRRMVSDACRDCSTDILCLERTKLHDPQMKELNDLVGSCGFDWVVKNSSEASGGIIIGIKSAPLNL